MKGQNDNERESDFRSVLCYADNTLTIDGRASFGGSNNNGFIELRRRSASLPSLRREQERLSRRKSKVFRAGNWSYTSGSVFVHRDSASERVNAAESDSREKERKTTKPSSSTCFARGLVNETDVHSKSP